VSDCPDIIISLRPDLTRAILEGRKTVELRRRKMKAAPGTRVWLYSKTPSAQVEGVARIMSIEERDLKSLWSEYSEEVGVSKPEFDAYFEGCKMGCAIRLSHPRTLSRMVALTSMREQLGDFHPPQFFKRLNAEELTALLQGSRGGPEPHESEAGRIRTKFKRRN
jgi:predicted transcriptional regulator